MAFDLQQVIKALLFSTGQPLAVKDIQGAFTRFHDEAARLALTSAPGALPLAPEAGNAIAAGAAPAAGAEAEPVEVPVLEFPELYQDVPSLVTAAQIREAMDAIAAELRDAGSLVLLTETAQGWRLVTQVKFARWVRALRNEPPPLKLSQSAIETLAVIAYRQPATRAEIETIRGVSAEAGLNKLLERQLIHITGRAEQLPASDVLSSRQIDEWLQNAAKPAHLGDAEMGLPLEPGERGAEKANETGELAMSAPAGGVTTPVSVP